MEGFDFQRGYEFYGAPRIVFGAGKAGELGRYFIELGVRSVFVVTDPQLSRLGVVDRLTFSLWEKGIDFRIFDRCEPDPGIESVQDAIESWKSGRHDAIMALGGGSTMDTAKIVGAAAAGNDLKDMLKGKVLDTAIPPMIALPTTSGTGSEVSPAAVVSDQKAVDKLMVRNSRLLPRIALVDPELTNTMPPEVTAATGADALGHLLGSYMNRNYNYFAQELDLKGICLVGEYLPRAVADGADGEARAGMAMASLLGGIGISNMGTDLVHAITSPLGAHYHLPHGVCVSLLLKAGLDYTRPAATVQYSRVARAMDGSLRDAGDIEAADRLPGMLADLLKRCGLPTGFKSDIDRSQFPEVARKAMKSFAVRGNPRPAEESDVLDILEEACNT